MTVQTIISKVAEYIPLRVKVALRGELFTPPMIVELHYDSSQPGQHPAISLLQELGYQIEWLNEVDYRSHIFAQGIPSTTESR